jgi:hypothetical protein
MRAREPRTKLTPVKQTKTTPSQTSQLIINDTRDIKNVTLTQQLDAYTLFLNLAHDVMHDFNLQGMCNRIYKNLLAIRNVVPTTLWNSNIVTYSTIIKSKGAKNDTALLINFIKSEGDDDEDGDMQSGGTKQEIEDFLKEYFEKNMYLDDIQTENYNQNELYAAILNVGTIITSYLGSVKKDNFLRLSSTATAAATSTTTGMDVEYGDEERIGGSRKRQGTYQKYYEDTQPKRLRTDTDSQETRDTDADEAAMSEDETHDSDTEARAAAEDKKAAMDADTYDSDADAAEAEAKKAAAEAEAEAKKAAMDADTYDSDADAAEAEAKKAAAEAEAEAKKAAAEAEAKKAAAEAKKAAAETEAKKAAAEADDGEVSSEEGVMSEEGASEEAKIDIKETFLETIQNLSNDFKR